MPSIVIVVFVAVLGTFLLAFLLANRYLQKRDTGKLRDRLLERVPSEKPGAAGQPLFRPDEVGQKKVINRLLAGMKQAVMLPFTWLLEIFPTFVRQLARDQGKQAELVIQGGERTVRRAFDVATLPTRLVITAE